jgi:hypothetical protein
MFITDGIVVSGMLKQVVHVPLGFKGLTLKQNNVENCAQRLIENISGINCSIADTIIVFEVLSI